MLKRLLENISNLSSMTVSKFDPSKYEDPLALQIEWNPLKRGGTNICTHRLKIIKPTIARFRISTSLLIIELIIIGIIGNVLFQENIISKILNYRLSIANMLSNKSIMGDIILNLVFSIVAIVLLYFSFRPIVFNKEKGFYWKGWRTPQLSSDFKNMADIEMIHAIQIIKEYVSSKRSYWSYELNLVLENGKRINVIDHGNLTKLRQDAQVLSEFLGRPIWDAVD